MRNLFALFLMVPKSVSVLMMFGLVSLLFYSTWWLQADRLSSPWLLFSFLAAVTYIAVQLVGSWILYIAAYNADRRRL
ncbi:MAG: hypothetical protein KDE54_16475 [Caldilineaceae bacterium]|nr:hypothetical protein [Caldilineaceae bacterium]MCB9151143.1 hypothetical protein [Caldilineaceae bacterium]